MKKIAIVIAELAAPGGAEKVAADLAQEFERRGYAVSIITFDDPPPPEYTLHPVGKRIRIHLPPRSGGVLRQLWLVLARAWSFYRIFQRERFEHIFSFLEAANVPCVLASKHAVLSMHLNPEVLSKKEWLLVRYLYPRAKQVIAVSEHMRDMLQQQALLTNVTCIYNPVISADVKELALQSIELDEPFILAVGRLSKQKRFDRLLQAYAQTKLQTAAKLIILGEGDERGYLEALIIQLGLQNKVLLLGYQDNPYRYMRRAHYLAMSSDYEGYPLTLIESLVLGCPVISVDCPTGPREIIQNEYNGLLVPLNNLQDLSLALDRLFFDNELRLHLKSNAPHSAANNDIQLVADTWLAV